MNALSSEHKSIYTVLSHEIESKRFFLFPKLTSHLIFFPEIYYCILDMFKHTKKKNVPN